MRSNARFLVPLVLALALAGGALSPADSVAGPFSGVPLAPQASQLAAGDGLGYTATLTSQASQVAVGDELGYTATLWVRRSIPKGTTVTHRFDAQHRLISVCDPSCDFGEIPRRDVGVSVVAGNPGRAFSTMTATFSIDAPYKGDGDGTAIVLRYKVLVAQCSPTAKTTLTDSLVAGGATVVLSPPVTVLACGDTPPITSPLPLGDVTAPVLGVLTLSGKAQAGNAIAVTSTLSESATVTTTLERLIAGRRSGTACRAGLRTGRRCTIVRTVGSQTVGAVAGSRGLVLPATLSKRGIAAGRYRLTATARDGAGNTSKARVLTLTVRR